MTDLKVCAGCHRHVAVEEHVCPFCSAALVAESPGGGRFARASRAAVFAGAALATTACGGKKPKADNVQNQNNQAQVDAGVAQPPPPPDNNVPMPYGAPPARRRVV